MCNVSSCKLSVSRRFLAPTGTHGTAVECGAAECGAPVVPPAVKHAGRPAGPRTGLRAPKLAHPRRGRERREVRRGARGRQRAEREAGHDVAFGRVRPSVHHAGAGRDGGRPQAGGKRGDRPVAGRQSCRCMRQRARAAATCVSMQSHAPMHSGHPARQRAQHALGAAAPAMRCPTSTCGRCPTARRRCTGCSRATTPTTCRRAPPPPTHTHRSATPSQPRSPADPSLLGGWSNFRKPEIWRTVG